VFEDVYYQYNPWWEETPGYEGIIERPRYSIDLERHLPDKTVVILTGLRRVGKTTIMKLFIRRLLRKGIPPTHIFYVSLDDYSLEKPSIIDIVSDYRKLHKLHLDTRVYLFLDEVAYKDRFQQQLKNLHDKQEVKIYASSSSSSVLKDKRSLLTGRETVIEVLPLDFDEYLEFKHLTFKKREAYLKEPHFEDYLRTGGMPEYVLSQERGYLTTLVDDILLKDIVAYHGIKNVHHVRDFFALLMERAGKQVSINKVAKILKVSPDTAKRYLEMFEETYLVHLVPRRGKLNESLLSPKKVYAADPGIRNLFTGFKDKGALFENYVYLLIRPLEPRYVYEDGNELDFYTRDDTLIEVKYGRELSAGQKALFERLPAKQKLLVSSVHDLERLKASMRQDAQ
jgi:uncharacterized protein